MGLARTMTATLVGVEAQIVTVEANVGPGLPGTFISGLADSSIKESVDRIKTAVHNSNLDWPKTKVIVNLTPASVQKSGTQCDLAMCMAIINAGQGTHLELFSMTLLLGEVGLDGRISAVPGVLPALLAARDAGLKHAVVPVDCAAEAAVVDGIDVYVATSIGDVFDWLHGRSVPHCRFWLNGTACLDSWYRFSG